MEVTRGDPVSSSPAEDAGRRAVYQEVIDGRHALGRRESVTFCVYTLDLDEGRGDVYVAIGLALALIERGYGVRLAERSRWHQLDPTDVVVAMLPNFEPADAGEAWTVAWVRNETDRWVRQAHLPAYDQVFASSTLALQRLRRVVPGADGVLPIGVDIQLFTPPADDSVRLDTAVTTAHFWGSVRDAHKALMDLPHDADVAMYGHADNAPAELLRWRRPSVPYFAIPELYRRARIVIDDMNWTTVGYGSVNSRFFEAAACGSLPIVNGALGAIGLGFDGVPRYRDSAELAQLLRELRADRAGTAALARRVGEQVRTEHSWEVRAAEFEKLLTAGRAGKRVSQPPRKAVHHFPPFISGDPLQSMLYSRLDLIGAHPVPIPDLPAHLDLRCQSRDPGVVHLLGTARILPPAGGPYRARQAVDDLTRKLRAFKAAGGRLVWTVDDPLPTDAGHRSVTARLAEMLSTEADSIHAFCEATLEAVDGLDRLDPGTVTVIEHASLVGQYPDWISRDAARARLGLLPQEKVVVALDGIGSTTGLRRVVKAFDQLAQRDPSLRLLVTGRHADDSDGPSLRELCEKSPRTLSRFAPLPHDLIQVWLGAADLAVVPPDTRDPRVILLAQSFGLPVLAPTGVDDAALARELRFAIYDLVADPDGAARARASARIAAERFTAADMALKFAEFIEPLVSVDALH